MTRKRSYSKDFKNIFCLLSAILLIGVTMTSCSSLHEKDQYSNAGEDDPAHEVVLLEDITVKDGMPLHEAIGQRRSVRDFDAKEISMDEISILLWAMQGITDKETGFRAAPSAGATYPLEIFVVKSDGAFQYMPQEHMLVKISAEDLRTDIMRASLHQSFLAQAPVLIIISAVYARTTSRYGERGKIYVHMEAGHVCQNLLLQATTLGLGAVPVGAFHEEGIAQILKTPKDHVPLYIIPVGHPAK
jgi:SagB-type dehydrogenase family enzyme